MNDIVMCSESEICPYSTKGLIRENKKTPSYGRVIHFKCRHDDAHFKSGSCLKPCGRIKIDSERTERVVCEKLITMKGDHKCG